jgi:hypothetical protein
MILVAFVTTNGITKLELQSIEAVVRKLVSKIVEEFAPIRKQHFCLTAV